MSRPDIQIMSGARCARLRNDGSSGWDSCENGMVGEQQLTRRTLEEVRDAKSKIRGPCGDFTSTGGARPGKAPAVRPGAGETEDGRRRTDSLLRSAGPSYEGDNGFRYRYSSFVFALMILEVLDVVVRSARPPSRKATGDREGQSKTPDG